MTPKTNVEKIKRVVAESYSVTVEAIDSRARPRNLFAARAVCMVIARNLLDLSDKELSVIFGRAQKTLIFARHKVRSAISANPAFHTRFLALQARCAAALVPTDGVTP